MNEATPRPVEKHCALCQKNHAILGGWWRMKFQVNGKLIIAPVDMEDLTALDKPNANEALVCGQHGVLVLTERYLSQRNFDPPPPIETAEAVEAEAIT